MLKIAPNPDFPTIDTSVLEKSDPEARSVLLDSDQAYNQAAENLKTVEEKKETPEETQTETLEKSETEETQIEKPEEEAKEELAESTNPFKDLGIPDNFIKDGKILGQYSSVEEVLKKLEGREKQAGKQAQEIGDLRKKVRLAEESEEKIKTLESKLQELQDTSPVKISELLFDEELVVPKGMTEDQTRMAHQYALDMTEKDLFKLFKKEGRDFPRDAEGWKNLALENQILYNDAESLRRQYLKDAIVITREHNSVAENYNDLIQAAVVSASNDVIQMLDKMNYKTSMSDPDFQEFANAAFRHMSSNEIKKDPAKYALFWDNVAGHDFPKGNALSTYMKMYRPELLQQLSSVEPEKEIRIDENESVQALSSSLRKLVDEDLPKYNIKIDVNDPKTEEFFNPIFEEIWADPTDTRYWKDGKLREDALSVYIWNNPEKRDFIITQALNSVKESAKTEQLSNEKRIEEEMNRRLSQATKPTPSIATDIENSKSGDTFSIPTPQQYANNLWVIKDARDKGISVENWYDRVDPLIRQLPIEERRKYGDFFNQ